MQKVNLTNSQRINANFLHQSHDRKINFLYTKVRSYLNAKDILYSLHGMERSMSFLIRDMPRHHLCRQYLMSREDELILFSIAICYFACKQLHILYRFIDCSICSILKISKKLPTHPVTLYIVGYVVCLSQVRKQIVRHLILNRQSQGQ